MRSFASDNNSGVHPVLWMPLPKRIKIMPLIGCGKVSVL